MPDANAPTPKLFVIQSKIGHRDWVLTVRNKNAAATAETADWKIGDCEVRLGHNTYSDAQIWVQETDSRGGFFLRAPGLEHAKNPGGAYLRASGPQGVGSPTLAGRNLDDPELIWRKENGEEWGCLNKLLDWEQKLQVKGNGPYDEKSELCCYEYDRGSEHELWKLVPYIPAFSSTNIVYGTPRIARGAPVTAASEEYVNKTSGPQTYTASLAASRTKSYTHTISDTSALTHAVSVSLGAKYKYSKALELSATATYTVTTSQSHTIGEQTTVSDTISATASVAVSVPPGKTYEVALMLNECSLAARYEATVTRLKPDGSAGTTYKIEGDYTYTGAYGFRVEVWEKVGGERVADVTQQAMANPRLELA